jgi:hypothetical protein
MEDRMITPLDIAVKAREIISNKNNWLQGARKGPSRDGQGIGHCALGAVDQANHKCLIHHDTYIRIVVDTLAKHAFFYEDERKIDPYCNSWYAGPKIRPEHRNGLKVANFNNIRTHEEVLKMFDGAIQELKLFFTRSTDR